MLEGVVHALGMSGDCSSIAVRTAQELAVEAELAVVVADLVDRPADDRRDVHVVLGRDLARDDHEAGVDEGLTGDSPLRSPARTASRTPSEIWVTDLVWVPLVTDSEVKRSRSLLAGWCSLIPQSYSEAGGGASLVAAGSLSAIRRSVQSSPRAGGPPARGLERGTQVGASVA